jgi:small GTP-binding protein
MKTLHYKVVFLGETSVGKSSIVSRFTRDEFLEFQEPTIGAAFQTKSINLEGECIVKMEFWDTAGQERYRALAPMYYRAAKAAFIVYDITNNGSLDNAKYWIKEVTLKGEPGCIIALLGNKIDIPNRRIEYKEVASFAKTNNIIFSEVSAKTGENINDIMIYVAKELVRTMPSQDNKSQPFVIRGQTNNKHMFNGCC